MLENGSSVTTLFYVFKESASVSTAASQQKTTPLDTEDGGRLTYQRNRSFLNAVQDLTEVGDEKVKNKRTGVQHILQVFITNAANIFLLDADDDGCLQDQVVCGFYENACSVVIKGSQFITALLLWYVMKDIDCNC